MVEGACLENRFACERNGGSNPSLTAKMKESWRFVKFVLLSISAGVIEMGSFALLNELLDWPYWPSYLIALTLSVLWNFTLNRKFTFRSNANVPRAMFLVFVYYLIFTPLSTWGGNYGSCAKPCVKN